jgi:hypothetical protein
MEQVKQITEVMAYTVQYAHGGVDAMLLCWLRSCRAPRRCRVSPRFARSACVRFTRRAWVRVRVCVRRSRHHHQLMSKEEIRSRCAATRPNRCLIEAPWLLHGGHGAPLRPPFGSPSSTSRVTDWHARAPWRLGGGCRDPDGAALQVALKIKEAGEPRP